MAKIPFFSKSRNIVRLLIDCGWEIINFRLHYTICPGNCQLIPYKNIDSFSWNLKGHFILTKELLVRQRYGHLSLKEAVFRRMEEGREAIEYLEDMVKKDLEAMKQE